MWARMDGEEILLCTIVLAGIVSGMVYYAIDRLSTAYCVTHAATAEIAKECRK